MNTRTRLHSWLSPKCFVANSTIGGLGLFAVEAFTAYELVAVCGGIVMRTEELETVSVAFPHFQTQAVQVADGFYLTSTSLTAIDDAERFNHSCDPNVGVKGQTIVLARRDIQKGEELVFDYDTTDIGSAVFECQCGGVACRKTIDGTGWMSAEFRKRNEGWLAWHVEQRIRGQ